jgi:septum formation protein
MHHLYLASSSPRRREILEKRNIQFEPLPLKVSEIPSENLNPLDQIRKISMDKLLAAQIEIKRQFTANQPYVLLCADTEVIFEGRLMGKPESHADACQTLGRLSGQSHEVTTVVTLFESSQNETCEIVVTTQVEFAALSPTEILDYVNTGDPMDKAGSYGIQNVPNHFITAFRGSFENVVGLPGDELMSFFQKKGWTFPKLSDHRTGKQK